ncbi:iron chelate uptake ABC transporter family permease subunit [Defluviimonas aestuarii]|uniref:metal ABC transporter permease n=1 Tax=Albidovulum aestuarii TaxID=1130726 RepID=UPI00249A057C|nr:iron chelate uptake ABC transporter family permease subunit [Defluviimonas aestuarii]MDI3336991.1 iron chelate uptake ABC transporter family permease subunit [Defluviimonas aestuarii]
MPDDFLIRAGLAGIGLMLAAGPLGAFVVWRRMAYMGDATAHAAILGVALALAASLPVLVGTMIVALTMALAVNGLSGRGRAADTALGVLAHSALALGLVAVSFLPSVRADLSSYLFGDVLTVRWGELIWIWVGSGAVMALILWRWDALLTATVNEELAMASGLDPRREKLVLTLALALVVAVALKIVGALLIAAMLIIPAATARAFARSPEAMALLSVLIGVAAVIAGLWASLHFDTPAGPSIVVAAAGLFAVSLLPGRHRG